MNETFVTFQDWLQSTFGLSRGAQDKLLTSLVIVLVLVLASRLVRGVIHRRTEDVRIRYRWSKISAYVLVPIGLFLVGRVWFEGFGSLATYLGLVSAGIAIALRDLLVNLAGWGFIIWRRPFEVGDRIEIGSFKGDVIDVRIFQFTLLEIGNWVDADQSTGRVVHVPNGRVLGEPLANYTKGFNHIWHEIPVLVTFESNWKKAKEILKELVQTHAPHLGSDVQNSIRRQSSQYLIFYQKLEPIVYTKVADSGVLFTMRFLTEPRKRRGWEEHLWEAVLERFGAEPDIDLAYPTTRFYDNRGEGKPGAGGPA